LHASLLEFTHPESGHRMEVRSLLPADCTAFLDRLRSESIR